jgi:hypothetical protein
MAAVYMFLYKIEMFFFSNERYQMLHKEQMSFNCIAKIHGFFFRQRLKGLPVQMLGV